MEIMANKSDGDFYKLIKEQRGHPLVGPCQAQKTPLHVKKEFFSCYHF